MKKSTKGALAASAAGVLLLGGAGSLAYWSSQSSIGGGTITAGTLVLGTSTCGDWTLPGDVAFNTSTDKIVPGDTLTRVCTAPITASGTRLKADLALSTANISSTVTDADIAASATYKVGPSLGAAVTQTQITSADDPNNVYATIVVTFPFGDNDTADSENGNGTKNMVATLEALSITATQVDPNS